MREEASCFGEVVIGFSDQSHYYDKGVVFHVPLDDKLKQANIYRLV